MSQRSGLGMVVSALRSAVSPGEMAVGLVAADSKVLTVAPFGATRRTCSLRSAAVAASFLIVLRTWMVADEALTSGVVTNVPHGMIWASPVVTRRTSRLMPAPVYQRLAGCCELSARTARTLLPGLRWGVSS